MAKILADTEIRQQLKREFNTTRQTVSRALNCHIHSDLANKIRALALKKGASVKGEENVFVIKSKL